MSRRLALLAAPLLLVSAVACAPEDDNSDTGSSTGSSASPSGDDCSVDNLTLYQDGKLTIATDSPAFPPWFEDDDPTNGKGYESAVAYEVADRLGFAADDVEWVKVRFNNSYQPGAKKFDFDINQISITPSRANVVDFSDPYYAAAQGVIALKDSPITQATTVSQLGDYKLGAQTGTTSLIAIREIIQPTQPPLVFTDTNAAKQALQNKQVDGIVADVPTAAYITGFEIPGSVILGQFQPEAGAQEKLGMLFEKGNPLVGCVNKALDEMKGDGTLDALETKWLSEYQDVPEMQP